MTRRSGIPWLLLLLLLPTGCGKKALTLSAIPNQRPVVRLTQAPGSSTTPYFYVYEVFWTSFDPDGRVERYLYCLDPPPTPGAETTWVETHENRRTLMLESGDADSLGSIADPGGFHVFVLKAVDDQGLVSEPVVRAFYSFTVAPTVEYVRPRANHLLSPMLPPTTSFFFTGTDPDGQRVKKPLYYRWKLFSDVGHDFDFLTALVHPDSLRRYYAPTFASWDSVAGDTCLVQVTNLLPEHKYVMAVVSFDEAGAYSPVFNYDTNLLYFLCQYTGRQGPRFTVWNDYFSYTYASGGYNPDPSSYLHIEVPAGQRVGFNWSAVPQAGSTLKSFRWALDIERLDDETPRSNEVTDWSHWSRATAVATSAVIGPFTGGTPAAPEQHLFYIEAEDNNGLKSLAVIQFNVIRPTYTRDLLFVDDTRFSPDIASAVRRDSVLAPGGYWPDAAELDTFFFARGGVRWRYYQPFTQLSPPGIFNGYDFDTLGTRGLANATVPLNLLAQYRHVVWYTDPAVSFNQAPYYPQLPMPLMRWMCSPGQNNSLALYSHMGGKLWLMGGGVAFNSLLPYNVLTNDGGGTVVFSSGTGELVPGRFVHGTAHWQSEIATTQPGGAEKNPDLRGDWPGAPDYSLLPDVLVAREQGVDPVPPMRGPGTYFQNIYYGEVLNAPNNIVQNVGPDPDHPVLGSVLDTLYNSSAGFELTSRPIMTYYHGTESGSVVFSGFPVWFFPRAQAIQVSDFVLQGVWGLPRRPVGR